MSKARVGHMRNPCGKMLPKYNIATPWGRKKPVFSEGQTTMGCSQCKGGGDGAKDPGGQAGASDFTERAIGNHSRV